MGDAWGGRWGFSWAFSWTRSADTPVSDDEFAEWLAKPNQRCVLAEFSAVGYDSVSSPTGTKTVNVYIANMGYTSHVADTPSRQHYPPWIVDIPTFRREMSLALSGRATAGFGSLVVTNPASATGGPGIRDEWLRMRWKRDYITLYLGDPSWAKSDFRVILKGRLKQPSAPAANKISFPLSDLADLFNGLLQTNKFESGPLEGRYKPLAIGAPSWVDLPILDDVLLKYQLNDGPIEEWYEVDGTGFTVRVQLFDNGISMDTVGGQGDSDASSDTLFFIGSPTPFHGFTDDSVFVIYAGSLPTGLDYFVRYFIVNATDTTWQVSATRGGSPIAIGASTFTFLVRPYWIDYATGVVTLTTQPSSSRITAGGILQKIPNFVVGYDQSAAYISTMLSYVMFEKGGISEDFKDADSFDDLYDALNPNHGAGLWVSGRDQATIGSVLDKISNGTNTWFGVTPEGLIQVGLLGLPAATSVMDFADNNTKGVRLASVVRPVDFAVSDVTYDPPNIDSPLFVTADGGATGSQVEKLFLPNYSYGAGVVPIDDHPDLTESGDPKTFDLIYGAQVASEQTRLANFYKKTLGVFEFQVKLNAITLSIGQTISLDHPRLGWKAYTAGDPQSPDNSADFDATKAVVIGIDVNLSAKDPFPVKLTVFRQIPGYYPTEDLN